MPTHECPCLGIEAKQGPLLLEQTRLWLSSSWVSVGSASEEGDVDSASKCKPGSSRRATMTMAQLAQETGKTASVTLTWVTLWYPAYQLQ